PDSGTQVILGGGPTGPTVFPLPEDDPSHEVDLAALRAADVSLWVEGLEFAGEVKLEMEVNDGTGSTCSDQIQLKVAPLILLGHLADPMRSYVSRIGESASEDPVEVVAESTAYTTQRFPGATPGGVIDEIIGDALNGNVDRWAQDEFQIGFQEAPYNGMYVVLDSKRDRELEPFPLSLLGVDFGHVQISSLGVPRNSLDSFGNLEVSPPCVVQGTAYPLGRIYYGDGGVGGRQIDPKLRAFLARQQVQSPVTLNSDWLLVGHVDEFMSIVPNVYATHGWTVLLADPQLALDVLEGDALVPGGVEPYLHIPRYRDHDNKNVNPPWEVDTVALLLGRPLDSPQSEYIDGYNSSTGPLATIVADLSGDISDAFGLQSSDDVLPVPVLFNHIDDPRLGTGTLAITPDLANGASYSNVYIAPDPFLHTFDRDNPPVEEDLNSNFELDPGEDSNQNQKLDTYRDPFRVWLNQNMPGDISIEYIDDWYLYHLAYGEVHCSSNEQRAVPVSPKWWEQTP
ncbi:MAG: hypothetical protein JSU86_06990, partial [Phycisphaerales bacterium]